MRELVGCGVIELNGDEFPIYCDSKTGSCYYRDTTQGGSYEIMGLDVEFPLHLGGGHRPELRSAFDFELLKQHVRGAFGFIATGVPSTVFVLHEEADGSAFASKFLWELYPGSVPTIEAPVPINIHAEAEIPDLDYGDGDGAIAYLKSQLDGADEDVLRTYLFRTLVLLGVERKDALREACCSDKLASVSTAELAKKLKNPRVVVDYARRMYNTSERCCKTYRSLVEGDSLYPMAGC